MYVALTRARRSLYLSHAQTRMLHGQTRYNIVSRFLDEIPAQLVRRINTPKGWSGRAAGTAVHTVTAYAAPAVGQWGDAGRNSASGPAQFAFNAAVGRTFRLGSRLNVDWRIDATNVLNAVTYSGINTLVGSPQFGLPNRANQMRRLQSSLRLRF